METGITINCTSVPLTPKVNWVVRRKGKSKMTLFLVCSIKSRSSQLSSSSKNNKKAEATAQTSEAQTPAQTPAAEASHEQPAEAYSPYKSKNEKRKAKKKAKAAAKHKRSREAEDAREQKAAKTEEKTEENKDKTQEKEIKKQEHTAAASEEVCFESITLAVTDGWAPLWHYHRTFGAADLQARQKAREALYALNGVEGGSQLPALSFKRLLLDMEFEICRQLQQLTRRFGVPCQFYVVLLNDVGVFTWIERLFPILYSMLHRQIIQLSAFQFLAEMWGSIKLGGDSATTPDSLLSFPVQASHESSIVEVGLAMEQLSDIAKKLVCLNMNDPAKIPVTSINWHHLQSITDKLLPPNQNLNLCWQPPSPRTYMVVLDFEYGMFSTSGRPQEKKMVIPVELSLSLLSPEGKVVFNSDDIFYVEPEVWATFDKKCLNLHMSSGLHGESLKSKLRIPEADGNLQKRLLHMLSRLEQEEGKKPHFVAVGCSVRIDLDILCYYFPLSTQVLGLTQSADMTSVFRLLDFFAPHWAYKPAIPLKNRRRHRSRVDVDTLIGSLLTLKQGMSECVSRLSDADTEYALSLPMGYTVGQLGKPMMVPATAYSLYPIKC